MTEVMAECLRVLKPGAHGLVWALPRTSHWTATALENAGFEIRDVVTHLFGTGFPKSLDISKAIDKAAGAERGKGKTGGNGPFSDTGRCAECGKPYFSGAPCKCPRLDLVPATGAAKQWQGWGTALKPSSEWWFLVQKPAIAHDLADELWYTSAEIGVLLCHLSSAKFAKRLSTSSQSVLTGDKSASVRWLADALTTLRSAEPSDLTDMSSSPAAASTFLSIATSWSGILDAASERLSTFTIATKSSLITDLKTLSCLLSLITRESTTLDEIRQHGWKSSASIAASLLSESASRLSCIQTRIAQGNVGATAASSPEMQSVSQRVDRVTTTGPSAEFAILVRKPCSEKTVAANVLKHGTGGINVDGCRILSDGKRPDICSTCAESPENTSASIAARKTKHAAAASSTSIAATSVAEQPSVDGLTTRSGGSTRTDTFASNSGTTPKENTGTYSNTATSGSKPTAPSLVAMSSTTITKTSLTTGLRICTSCGEPITLASTTLGSPSGRFPSNLVLSHSEGCRQVGTKKVKAIAPPGAPSRGKPEASGGSWAKGKTTEKLIAHNDGDGTETVEAWECEPGCAVRMLDEQSGLAKPKPARSGRIGGLKGEVFGNGNTGFNPEGEGYWPADPGGGASRFFYCAKASKSDRNRKVKRGEQASNREVHKPDELFDSSGNPSRRQGA